MNGWAIMNKGVHPSRKIMKANSISCEMQTEMWISWPKDLHSMKTKPSGENKPFLRWEREIALSFWGIYIIELQGLKAILWLLDPEGLSLITPQKNTSIAESYELLQGVTTWNIAFEWKLKDMLRAIQCTNIDKNHCLRIVERSPIGGSSHNYFLEWEGEA